MERDKANYSHSTTHIETFTFHNAHMETGNTSRGQQLFQGGHGAMFDNWREATGSDSYLRTQGGHEAMLDILA